MPFVKPRPEWIHDCQELPQPPLIFIQCETGTIMNYWQEVETIDNVIQRVSYKRIYDYQGKTIADTVIIPNEEYPGYTASCIPVSGQPPSADGPLVCPCSGAEIVEEETPEEIPEIPEVPETPACDINYTTTG